MRLAAARAWARVWARAWAWVWVWLWVWVWVLRQPRQGAAGGACVEWVAGVVFAMGAAGAAGSPLVRMSEGTRVQMSMRWT